MYVPNSILNKISDTSISDRLLFINFFSPGIYSSGLVSFYHMKVVIVFISDNYCLKNRTL